MSDDVKIIVTSDGSHSLLNTRLQETYHSTHGAIQESNYVFLHQGLDPWRERNTESGIKILEVGFGTGLNALLTYLHTSDISTGVYYESWETSPLDASVVNQLNYGTILKAEESFQQMHQAPWNQTVNISSSFVLHKKLGDITRDALERSSFDVVFYDAFAPSRQPEMWTFEVLNKVTASLRQNGVWVTYCAKGQVKRDLKSMRMLVETLPGPPGKKEMIRARAIK